jgi:hypothetical protein
MWERISVIYAGALIALAILFVFRWEVTPIGKIGAMRLDRWTGRIDVCLPSGSPKDFFGSGATSIPYACESK